ncbi:hypothetical protein CK203_034241 [Vitis vinifera]|uniref:Uncharacterized protein n=1 Tax=Vitis vinifera TaxID=29760 RepID=A0A438INQ6_VITVI|nr:hypothetical protein CK203_034241 [Vitis vinifera]
MLVSLPNGRHMVYSFTVSYLKFLWIVPKTALSASKKIHFETPEQSDSVLTLLRGHGCTNTHISKIVSLIPSLILGNPEKTLFPKLEFFRSVAFPRLTLEAFSLPILLRRNLENYLIPNYKFLKSVVMVNENVVRAYKKSYWLSCRNLENIIVPNIAILRESGVPKSNILYLLTCHPVSQVIYEGTESAWEHRMEVYRRCGWTDYEIMLMFRQGPYIMNFLAQFGEEDNSKVFSGESSANEGVGKEEFELKCYFGLHWKGFLDKFVVKYQEDIPHLFNVYKGKMDFLELDFGSDIRG